LNDKPRSLRESLADQVKSFTGESVANCYQCAKCSGGCPLAEDMDIPPSQLLHMIQLGMPEYDERVLKSLSIWLCLTCEMCVTRCPKEVDLPKIMDFLRQESLSRGLTNPQAKKIISFHKAFLDAVQYTGRLYEVGLTADYKLRRPETAMQDVLTAPGLFTRGKLKLFPEMIKGRDQIAKIFARTLKKEGK
jgi:heterodisulfide reductase subunit C2